VLDAVIVIAGGGAGGVPGLIETALATAIPVLIGFLAALLGIGGLADKVKKLFQSLSKPVMKAVDWIVGKIATLAKKLWAKLKSKLGGGKKKNEKDADHDQKLAAGLAAIDREEQAFLANGTIFRRDAERVAAKVKSEHRVFKSLAVVDGDRKWDYKYVASSGKKTGPEKKEEEIKKVAEQIREKLKSPLLRPGTGWGGKPISASNPDGYTRGRGSEQEQINKLGYEHGDHHTPSVKEPGWASGDWTPDHQPVTNLIRPASEGTKEGNEIMGFLREANLPTTLAGQKLYPHSAGNVKPQGGTVTAIILKVKKLVRLKDKVE